MQTSEFETARPSQSTVTTGGRGARGWMKRLALASMAGSLAWSAACLAQPPAAGTLAKPKTGAPSIGAAASSVTMLPGGPTPADVPTTEVAGVKFANTVQVGGTRLVLNGAGIRRKYLFKVYAAALYLSSRESTYETAMSAGGAKRLDMVMLREVNSDELARFFSKGMEDNSPRDEYLRLIPGLLISGNVFASRHILREGESVGIEWIPGIGTQLFINGQPVDSAIKEPEFFPAMMRMWLGKNPGDSRLKDALLGKDARVATTGASPDRP